MKWELSKLGGNFLKIITKPICFSFNWACSAIYIYDDNNYFVSFTNFYCFVKHFSSILVLLCIKIKPRPTMKLGCIFSEDYFKNISINILAINSLETGVYTCNLAWGHVLSLKSFCQIPVLHWEIGYVRQFSNLLSV